MDRNIPLHFSRYFRNFEMDLPATPLEKLRMARDIAQEKLSYVYIRNAPELNGSDTHCPECGRLVISRAGYRAGAVALDGKKCARCGSEIAFAGDMVK